MIKRQFLRNSRGAALIEVIIAIVVLAMITASVPPVLLALDKSQFPTPMPNPAPTPGHIPVNFAEGEKDKGLQQVTVSVYHVDKPIIEIKTYKADR